MLTSLSTSPPFGIKNTMSRLFFIGDIHGLWWGLGDVLKRIKKTLNKDDEATIILLGDIGLFTKRDCRKFDAEVLAWPFLTALCGNHDNPLFFNSSEKIKYHMRYVGLMNDSVEIKIKTLGGGHSIDKHLRREGVDWWKDEIPEKSEVDKLLFPIPGHEGNKEYIHIFATHECPKYIVNRIYPDQKPGDKYDDTTLYESPLSVMFDDFINIPDADMPKYWFFGHHHQTFCTELLGVKFVGLDELQCVELNVKTDTITGV